MRRQRRRKCRCCSELFYPDVRNVRHQHFCGKAACRQASKRHSQGKWRRKPENRDYFRGPEHVERVRAWRAKHPEYWKRSALQDVLMTQSCDKIKESRTYNFSTAPGWQQPPVFPASARCSKSNGLAATLEKSPNTEGQDGALQDVLAVEKWGHSTVLIGLIGKLIGSTLQDDIASTATSLLRLGEDILQGGSHGAETASRARTSPVHPEGELQLG